MNAMHPAEGLRALREALAGIDRILVVTHVNPDGDAVGSVLSMRGILEAAGKKVEVVISDDITKKYSFLVDKPVLKLDDPELSGLSLMPT